MRLPALAAAVAACLALPTAADAAVTSVFSGTSSPVSCTPVASGPITGARICTATPSTVPSFDGTPIDVAVALPPEPVSGPDGDFPVVGVYPGWSGGKVTLSGTDANTQRWVSRGYAVFTVTPRGWRASCGASVPAPKPAACANGHIHLMHNAYEVRDVQHLLGLLADEGIVDGQRTAATGGSYGGGMSLALGALNDRTQLANGTLVPWQSPGGKPMRTAAATPDIPWSDLPYSLVPNGSTLDYVADAPYFGVSGDRRIGVQKQAVNASLYGAGTVFGFYAPKGSDPQGDMVGWNDLISTGGPYDGDAATKAALDELSANHSGYGIDASRAPAPMLLSSGWNDDLFPVSETVRYYNKVRTLHPSTPIKMFHSDHGHARGGTEGTQAASLATMQTAWIEHYVSGVGPAPANARGGVDIMTSTCPATSAGAAASAPSWAALAPGEIRLTSAPAKTVGAPGTAPNGQFVSGNVCATTASEVNGSAATYTLDPAPSTFTIAGAATIIADTTVTGANDALIGRLYDVDPGASTQRMIARTILRPTGVGAGPTRQVFQLHPQAYAVAAGHVLKLELLPQDSPYARLPAAAMPQEPITVANLELRVPVLDAPGSIPGVVQAPAAKVVPAGYELARGFAPPLTAPASAAFAGVEQGRVGTARTIAEKNTGSADAEIQRVRMTGHDPDAFLVSRDECAGEVLEPNETCVIAVRFAPEAQGPSTASLSVSSDVTSPLQIALTGTGTAPVGGPKGDTGATGDTGAKGDTGAPGAKGDTGAHGAPGAAGAQGPAGPKGDRGEKGEPGLRGATGPRGAAATVTCTPKRVRNTVRVTCSVRLKTAKGARVALVRGGRTYATAKVRRGSRVAALRVTRPLRAGSYTVRVTTPAGRTTAPLTLKAR